jgi:hypothetical protein
MAKSRKEPPLSDWQVHIPGTFPDITIRATYLQLRSGSYVLEDTYGQPLFTTPAESGVHVRRLESGEKAAKPNLTTDAALVAHMAEVHDQHFTTGFSHGDIARAHEAVHAAAADPLPESASAEKVTPAPRGRRTR